MSIENTLQLLAARLANVNPDPQPPPNRIWANPAEAVSLGDFPAIVLALAPSAEGQWSMEALGGYGRNDYSVAIWVFVGARSTGINELYARILPWPKAIADVLLQDLTLGGNVSFIGNANPSTSLFSWSPKFIQWADGQYFGLEIILPVTERHIQTIG